MQRDGAARLRVTQGALKGSRLRTASAGRPYSAFLALPYAKPPLGPLRFKPPQPAEGWSGELDATREPPIAPQCNVVVRQFQGDEDCLYLNVYTPADLEGCEQLPVMVWIHGGAFCMGSGNSDMYGPDHLLERRVVVVTLNYRLGALGFASTGDLVISGNMGLKDQVMALRWVRDNIRSFGGDPHNVTIFGESAGGMSCHALVLSPMAKGLFCRAIIQSGVVTADGVCSSSVSQRTLRLAQSLGAAGGDSQQVAAFLRQLPAQTLVEKAEDAFSPEERERMVVVPFVPTVEPEDAEGGAFFSRHPLDILRSGDYHRVPIIMGVTSLEGSTFLMGLPGAPADIAAISRASVERLLPLDLPDRAAAASDVTQYYLQGQPLGEDTLLSYLQLRGDLSFVYPAVRAARLLASQPSPPVYFYVFSVDAGFNFVKAMFNLASVPGAAHGDELCYLFRGHYPGLSAPAADPQSEEGRVSASLTALWGSFAGTGDPTPASEAVTWPPFTPDCARYLDINNGGLDVLQEPFRERVAFWDKLYGTSV